MENNQQEEQKVTLMIKREELDELSIADLQALLTFCNPNINYLLNATLIEKVAIRKLLIQTLQQRTEKVFPDLAKK